MMVGQISTIVRVIFLIAGFLDFSDSGMVVLFGHLCTIHPHACFQYRAKSIIWEGGGRWWGGHYINTCTSNHDQGQDLDPSKFDTAVDYTENLPLTLDYPALAMPIEGLERLGPFPNCPNFLLNRLTSFEVSP